MIQGSQQQPIDDGNYSTTKTYDTGVVSPNDNILMQKNSFLKNMGSMTLV